MSTLSLYVPTVLGQAVWDRLTAQTTAIHNDTSGGVDPRSFDQIRHRPGHRTVVDRATIRGSGRPA